MYHFKIEKMNALIARCMYLLNRRRSATTQARPVLHGLPLLALYYEHLRISEASYFVAVGPDHCH